MTFDSYKNVGKLVRIDFDQDTGEMHIVVEITDAAFKSKILHSDEYDTLLRIVGKEMIQYTGEK